MLSFFRYLKGYVFVYLYGFSPERFLNLCNHHHIKVWKVHPYQDGYQFYISVRDLFQTKEFLKKTKTKVVIRKKLGLPFWLFRYRKRKVFAICLAVCFISLFMTTRFIWSFSIDGNRTMTEDIFVDFLRQENISYGTPAYQIDTDALEKKLRDQFSYITWASFQVDGTRLCLTVKENQTTNEQTTDQTDEKHPFDLCASVDGTVKNMVTRNGTPMVKIGDAVKAGDVLISGLIFVYNDDETVKTIHQTQADGDISIEYEMLYQDGMDYHQQKKIYTGRSYKRPVVGWKDKEFGFSFHDPYEHGDIFTQKYIFSPEIYQMFPVYIGYEKYQEYTMTEEILNKDTALCRLDERFCNFCKSLNQKGIQIIKKDVTINYKKDRVDISVNLTVLMSDGVETPILSQIETGE